MKKKNVNIISKRAKRNLLRELDKNGFADIHGELEVMAHDSNGKMIHYDKGDNVVTIWAKHATMHLLTGESFTTHGTQRSFDPEAHVAGEPGQGVNLDGTLLSGQQYFEDNQNPDFSLNSRWSKSTINPDPEVGDNGENPEDVKYPFFPTKMLFGTGFEWHEWNDIPENFRDIYEEQDWDDGNFNPNVLDPENDYSATYPGGDFRKTRSMNHVFSGALTSPEIDEADFAVPGAIKNGLYTNSDEQKDEKLFADGGNYFLVRDWAGVGKPCFIYARRQSRFFQEQSEVSLTADENVEDDNRIENKITFTVVMPEQTGADSGIFYPYNGYTLKVAGLFADARLLLENQVPESGREKELYDKMNYGIMYAKRYIAPIQKSHDVSISSRWTLYL